MTKSPKKEYFGVVQDVSPNLTKVDDLVIYNGTTYQHPPLSACKDSMKKRGLKQTSIVIVLVALPLLFLAVSLGWIIVPCIIRHEILKKAVISPEVNPELYSAWIHPPVPVYLKVYLFNISNPKEFQNGSKPKLLEMGPYIFRENRTKVNIHHDDATNDAITYEEHITYHFEQRLSGNAKLEDKITIINVPFAAAAIKIAHDLPWPMNDLAQMILINYKESLFIEKTVEEALFKGWKVPFLEKIEQDVGFTLIPSNEFGFFVGQNDTEQGPYTVSRGSEDKSSLGVILKFKNQSELDFWTKSSTCNQIQGTDGTIFSPFVQKSTVLRLFNPELCRSVYLTYTADTDFEGIRGYRFTAPASVMKDPTEGDENRCFCIYDDDEKCLKQGALDLGPCREGAPIAMSTPHFLDANAEYIENSGLVPHRHKHETFLDIEPTTGIILQASKKIQVNLILKRVNGISSMSRVPEMLLPLVWADECASLDAESKGKFQSALFYLWLADFISKWVLLAIALIVSLLLITRKLRRKGVSLPPLFMSKKENSNVLSGTKGCEYKNSCVREDDTSEVFASQQVPLQENHSS
ncbi:Scavenger receptor class B member 1 [Orchesella cincta]|uniref:Scavenger receptor class B member 1 n=1 Tax=Orchesella cincta TaxID=48709 RepID=A0A1D2MJQ6_ORCCI|nr:Scavenger receptor class B member 1 [Orchesella cincta]